MSKFDSIDNNKLLKLYEDDRLNTYQIADMFDVYPTTIQKKLRILEDSTGREILRHGGNANCANWYVSQDRNLLKKLYVDEKLTAYEVAERLGISLTTTKRRLHEFGLMRTVEESSVLRQKDVDLKLLTKLYVDEGKSIWDIVDETGYSSKLVYTRLIGLGVMRTMKERWTDPDFKNKMMGLLVKSRKTRPNECEKLVDAIISIVGPSQFGYNGGFELGIVIAGKIPDWINVNGKKQIIEFNGCFWHDCPECYPNHWNEEGFIPKIRALEYFEYGRYVELGYDFLVIWEHELNDILKVGAKVKEFSRSE